MRGTGRHDRKRSRTRPPLRRFPPGDPRGDPKASTCRQSALRRARQIKSHRASAPRRLITRGQQHNYSIGTTRLADTYRTGACSMPSFSTPRAGTLLGVIVALFVTLCGRVAWLQTYGSEQTILRADRQQHLNVPLQARRGGIFDRNGILMAGTIQTKTLFIDPKFMAEEFDRMGQGPEGMNAAIAKLADLLDKNPAELRKTLADNPAKRYIKVADDLDSDTCDQIAQLDFPGIGVVPTSRRVYPMGSIACHLLGGVGSDGSGIEG